MYHQHAKHKQTSVSSAPTHTHIQIAHACMQNQQNLSSMHTRILASTPTIMQSLAPAVHAKNPLSPATRRTAHHRSPSSQHHYCMRKDTENKLMGQPVSRPIKRHDFQSFSAAVSPGSAHRSFHLDRSVDVKRFPPFSWPRLQFKSNDSECNEPAAVPALTGSPDLNPWLVTFRPSPSGARTLFFPACRHRWLQRFTVA
jgi:hypothetical protein